MTSLLTSILALAQDLLGIIHQAAAGKLTPEEARAAARSRVKVSEQQWEALPADQAADFDVLRDG